MNRYMYLIYVFRSNVFSLQTYFLIVLFSIYTKCHWKSFFDFCIDFSVYPICYACIKSSSSRSIFLLHPAGYRDKTHHSTCISFRFQHVNTVRYLLICGRTKKHKKRPARSMYIQNIDGSWESCKWNSGGKTCSAVVPP